MAEVISASYITCLASQGSARAAVDVHQAGQQFLVEAAPVDADAHRLVPAHGGLDHLAELAVALVALAHVAGVDAVLGQRLGAGRIVGEQAVAVVVEVADQRHVDAHAVELLADVGHLRRGLGRVDGDAHHLGAGDRQFLDLDRGADGVHRVGVGHRLDAHRRVAADGDDARAPDHAAPGANGAARGAAGSIGRQVRGHASSSWLHLEARHVVAARDRRQVERLAAHLHVDGRRVPTVTAQRQRAGSARRFAGLQDVRCSNGLPLGIGHLTQDVASRVEESRCRRRPRRGAGGGRRALARRRRRAAEPAPARPAPWQPAAPTAVPAAIGRRQPATAGSTGTFATRRRLRVGGAVDLGRMLVRSRLRQPEQHRQRRPAASRPPISSAAPGQLIAASWRSARRWARGRSR